MDQALRHYSDFFSVDSRYHPVMTREAINESPDKWLDFYPHETFSKLLRTLLARLKDGAKSVWLNGNYGTGKSNASLVVQKLFMDDVERVNRWFNDNKKEIQGGADLQKDLFALRDSTLVVYDYDADGLKPTSDFLVRLEKGVCAALKEFNLPAPPRAGNLDAIIQRLREEGNNFIATMKVLADRGDVVEIKGRKDVEQIIDDLNRSLEVKQPRDDDASAPASSPVLEEILRVFQARSIFLDVSVSSFRNWIASVLKAAKLERVVYIFDEFSGFIDENKNSLKTFEDVTENPGVNKFYLVPVTHRSINAYAAVNSDGAKKANSRFDFCKLEMPNDTAFQLVKRAMKVFPDMEDEWKDCRDRLWDDVKQVAEDQTLSANIKKSSFYDILPLHPMTAFLLKALAESASANQRSIFEYMKGNPRGNEFRDFIQEGGPGISNKQLLTADYLWRYFIERDDLGLDRNIDEIRLEYKRLRQVNYPGKDEKDEPRLRVLKAVLLFILLSRLTEKGHERLLPTVENLELTFQGDGAIVNVEGLLKDLEEKHCISISSEGYIDIFAFVAPGTLPVDELRDKFYELLSDPLSRGMSDALKLRQGVWAKDRFFVKVSDVERVKMSSLRSGERDRVGDSLNKDDGSIGLWFVFAKDPEEEMKASEKIGNLLKQLEKHRILMFVFPNKSFCEDNKDLWEDYIKIRAQYNAANDESSKRLFQGQYQSIENKWINALKTPVTKLVLYRYEDGAVVTEDITWTSLKDALKQYAKKTLPCCPDFYSEQTTAFADRSLRSWAECGMKLNSDSGGPQKQLAVFLRQQGVESGVQWLKNNSEHPFGKLYEFFRKKIENTIGRQTTFSLRRAYLELRRAPYGMRPTGLTAFIVGLALGAATLDKNYRWTDNKNSGELNSSILAEIIESVVKADGEDIKNEKLICRLSKEEKAVLDSVPKMFNTLSIESGKLEDASAFVQESVGKNSGKVPLWILTRYVRRFDDARSKAVASILDNICVACRTSSKGAIEERASALQEIGRVVLDDPEVVGSVAELITRETFRKAFLIYIDECKPELPQLAESLGDVAHRYADSILERLPSEAGILWNETDLSGEIEAIYTEYSVVLTARPLLGGAAKGFAPFTSIFDILKNRVETLGVSGATLASAHPSLAPFFDAIKRTDVKLLLKSLEDGLDAIRDVVFDVQKSAVLNVLRPCVNIAISDDELRGLIAEIDGAFDMERAEYEERLRRKLDEWAQSSLVRRLLAEWARISGGKSVDEWACDERIPVRWALGNNEEATDLYKTLRSPENFSNETIKERLAALETIEKVDVWKLRKSFVAAFTAGRYGKFGVDFEDLARFLTGIYGRNPNDWPLRPSVERFFKERYEERYSRVVEEQINRMSPDELKERVLNLVRDNFDLGMEFLNEP